MRCHLWSKAIFSGADELKTQRSCHSATMDGTNIFMFGGFGSGQWYNTVSILDTKDMTWRKRQAKGDVPCKRYAHVAAQDEGKMYVFGGFGGAEGHYLNDIYALDMKTLEWRRVQPDGEPPCPRAAAASAYDPSSRTWFIHGGNAGDHRLNDLHALNLRTLQWRRIGGLQVQNSPTSVQAGPGPRAGHTMTLVGTELHLFGGGDTSALDVPEMADVFNDHYVCDLRNIDWARPELQWRCPPADGVPPAPRAGHGAVAVGKQIYIVGGHGHKPCQEGHISTARFLNDVHALNVETNEWRQCTCGGAVPTPRAGFALLERSGTLYVAGGGDAQTVRNDLFVLNVLQMVDFPLDEDDELPSGSVLFVPGLEQKLKKRMKKADLVHKNILKQTSVGSDGTSGSQEWWAARASVERKQLDQKLGRFLQNRNDAEHLRQRNILRQERETIDPKLGGVVLKLEKAHRTRDLERLLQNRKSPDEVARQLARHDANQEHDDHSVQRNGEILAWAGVPSKQTSDQVEQTESLETGGDDVSPLSKMWPKLPAPAAQPISTTSEQRQPSLHLQQQQQQQQQPELAPAERKPTTDASLSAGDRRRLNRVLAFQKRGEEKKRVAAAVECAAAALRDELQRLPRSQLRTRALQSGVSQRRMDEAEDSSDNPYAVFIDLVVDHELRSTEVGEQCNALRLEPVPTIPAASRTGSPGSDHYSDRYSSNHGTISNVTLSPADVQELCESIAAELGSFRHMCKEDNGNLWLESERRLLRILRERLRSHALPSVDCSPSPRENTPSR